jgi:two-component system, chemotaxis family, protein-glutamate methylesterase/glutaminase
MARHDIIVVGASAGGVEALVRLVRALPPVLPAAVFVVLHVPAGTTSVLPNLLSRAGPLPAVHPKHNDVVELGRVYVAPPDRHLLIADGRIQLTLGARENGHRPAIDPLFRTAARTYGRRVVGVVLSGALDDGTAGLSAIKMRGGMAIVQQPDDALFPSMPNSAMAYVAVDHVLSAEEIGSRLAELVAQPIEAIPAPPPSATMQVESLVAEVEPDPVHEEDRPGSPSPFACPECGGVLWELDEGELLRFRCRVGHAYSPDTLTTKQLETLEDALWAALRALEEQAALARRLAGRARDRGQRRVADRFSARADAARGRTELIRQALTDGDGRGEAADD